MWEFGSLPLGGFAGGPSGFVIVDLIGSLGNVWRVEASYGMGVVFFVLPVAGLAGALLLGGWITRS
jgi:hypothetical protein